MSYPQNGTATYMARPLSRTERSRSDTYIALSPKQGAIVELTSVLSLAFWLRAEFDPNTTQCVPRPRTLVLPSEREIEIDFWTRTRDGQERFWVVIGRNDFENGPNGIAPRDVRMWDHAAHNAGITVQFIFEHQLDRCAQRVANYLRLLPHVQAARRNSRIGLIGDRILELFGAGIDSLTFRQIENALAEFDAVQTRMAASVLIHAGAIQFDADLPLTNVTALRQGGAG